MARATAKVFAQTLSNRSCDQVRKNFGFGEGDFVLDKSIWAYGLVTTEHTQTKPAN